MAPPLASVDEHQVMDYQYAVVAAKATTASSTTATAAAAAAAGITSGTGTGDFGTQFGSKGVVDPFLPTIQTPGRFLSAVARFASTLDELNPFEQSFAGGPLSPGFGLGKTGSTPGAGGNAADDKQSDAEAWPFSDGERTKVQIASIPPQEHIERLKRVFDSSPKPSLPGLALISPSLNLPTDDERFRSWAPLAAKWAAGSASADGADGADMPCVMIPATPPVKQAPTQREQNTVAPSAPAPAPIPQVPIAPPAVAGKPEAHRAVRPAWLPAEPARSKHQQEQEMRSRSSSVGSSLAAALINFDGRSHPVARSAAMVSASPAMTLPTSMYSSPQLTYMTAPLFPAPISSQTATPVLSDYHGSPYLSAAPVVTPPNHATMTQYSLLPSAPLASLAQAALSSALGNPASAAVSRQQSVHDQTAMQHIRASTAPSLLPSHPTELPAAPWMASPTMSLPAQQQQHHHHQQQQQSTPRLTSPAAAAAAAATHLASPRLVASAPASRSGTPSAAPTTPVQTPAPPAKKSASGSSSKSSATGGKRPAPPSALEVTTSLLASVPPQLTLDTLTKLENITTRDVASLPHIPPQKKGNSKRKVNYDELDDKRKFFLERNRMAAFKCRQKKKHQVAATQAKTEYLTLHNDQLQTQIAEFQAEVARLRRAIDQGGQCIAASAHTAATH
ncbi:Transcription factor [Sorochytrium milnesiophthora]